MCFGLFTSSAAHVHHFHIAHWQWTLEWIFGGFAHHSNGLRLGEDYGNDTTKSTFDLSRRFSLKSAPKHRIPHKINKIVSFLLLDNGFIWLKQHIMSMIFLSWNQPKCWDRRKLFDRSSSCLNEFQLKASQFPSFFLLGKKIHNNSNSLSCSVR